MKLEKISVDTFLGEVEKELCLKIEREAFRFPSYKKLLNKFRGRRSAWKDTGSKFTSEITEVTNELCVANIILSDTKTRCKNLEYEPILSGSAQSIDFCALMDDERTIYCDVKTIRPRLQDDWKKYKKEQKKGHFPKNVHVDLFKNGLGGEVWHNWYNSRGSMLEYAIELEEKIKKQGVKDKTIFGMTFCSDGFDWELDKLEDFADFYRTGRHNPDDSFSIMEDYHIKTKGIKLLRNINGFCYLGRETTKVKVKKFVCPVQGPWQ